MRIEGNADSGQWQWAARNAMMPAKPETVMDQEPDGDQDNVKKTALQPAQTLKINPNDEQTGTRVNLLA
jgi:hypothetical protein